VKHGGITDYFGMESKADHWVPSITYQHRLALDTFALQGRGNAHDRSRLRGHLAISVVQSSEEGRNRWSGPPFANAALVATLIAMRTSEQKTVPLSPSAY
jgi:hypothetical protein